MKKYITIAIAALIAIAVAYFCLHSCMEQSGIGTEEERRTEITPAVLDSIRSIGEWQLMTVPLTLEVDTMQKRWLGMVKDKLRRSYSGTMSLGINLHKLQDEWHEVDGDTITLTMPDVCLLDSNFIDESKTRLILSESNSFESDPKVKGAMLRKARNRMISVGITSANLQNCRDQATKELEKRFKAIGYKGVKVKFND